MLDRYPDILKRARERAFKEANSTSIADIKGYGPKAMKVDDLLDQVKVDPDVWTEVVGTNKKEQVHGLGCILDIGICDHRDTQLPEDTSVSTVKPVSQADITEAIKEALPSAINAVLPIIVNEVIQSNILYLLSKIPGFPQEKDH
ncbi:hypothetical protein Ahy_A10g048667 [Arachis hypogaea]|uniref:Uncharacterized protein n=1 Tax=Arachis hypogaea TaxID=3818 RepID=A0A445B5L7_ARAHY|nr:hypothetical protein Ahy_A10g048667 [Arachis hypogaea]